MKMRRITMYRISESHHRNGNRIEQQIFFFFCFCSLFRSICSIRWNTLNMRIGICSSRAHRTYHIHPCPNDLSVPPEWKMILFQLSRISTHRELSKCRLIFRLWRFGAFFLSMFFFLSLPFLHLVFCCFS